MHTTMRPPETNATKPGVPLIGFGQVRHTRLAPVRNAFAYGNYFLMLPMRRLRTHGAGALACNRFAPLSFHDADHGDGRGPERGGALAWLDSLLADEGIGTVAAGNHTDAAKGRPRSGRWRSLAALLPPCPGPHLQARQLLVLPPQGWLAARHCGGGEQHLWRTPLLPAGPTAVWRGAACGQSFPCITLRSRRRWLSLSLHGHTRTRPNRGAHRL
jgi:hypothetical protein